MDVLNFYTKPDCPLCDKIRQEMEESEVYWQEINIQTDPELFARYRHEIPVLQKGKREWFYRDREKQSLREWLNQGEK